MECEKCSNLIADSEKQFDPFVASPRSGGCARCQSAGIKMDQYPCRECIEEETKTNKFPRFTKQSKPTIANNVKQK